MFSYGTTTHHGKQVLTVKFNFHGKKIGGILTVVPKNIVDFDDEISNFKSTPKQMRRLKQVMGFGKRRIAEIGTTVSDLAVFGVEKLFAQGLMTREEIGAMLVVTQTPDYLVPPTANVIQGRLNLSHDVYCLDIDNGCAGYVVGLVQAFQLLEHMTDKKVLLVAGDLASKFYSKKDRKTYPLMGDGISITIVENDASDEKIFVEIRMDGTRADAIIIPAGGMKLPRSAETAKEFEDDDGNIRTLNDCAFKGGEIFNFTQVDVPPLIEDVIAASGKSKSDIDYFLFHQPNKFMVDRLAEVLDLPPEKVPDDIITFFGNASAATIPTAICFKLKPDILQKSFDVCMSGFGTGLNWGALVMKLGALRFCDIAEFNEVI